MLQGLGAISAFLGKSIPTTRKLIVEEGLPASKIRSEWTSDRELIIEWQRDKIRQSMVKRGINV